MATTPNYAAASRSASAAVSAANTAYDGSGTIVTVMTAGTSGTRIDAIHVAATGTTAAGQVTLFVSDTTGSNTTANTHYVRSIGVTAITASATVAPFAQSVTTANNGDFLPLFLPAGYTLRAATTVAQALRVTAQGADF